MPIDESKDFEMRWNRYKDTRLMLSDHYYNFGVVVAITGELLEKEAAIEVSTRVSPQFFCIKDKILSLHTREERFGLSLDSKTQAYISWELLKLMLPHPHAGEEPNICIRNKHIKEEIFWPLQLTDTTAIYLYPWTSRTGSMPEKFAFQTYITSGKLFSWNLEGVLSELDARLPLLKHDIALEENQKISELVSYTERSSYETFLFKTIQQFSHFLKNTAVKEGHIDLTHHLPYYDTMLLGIRLFVSNQMTLNALGIFLKCIIQKRKEHQDFIHKIFSVSELKPRLNMMIESPFVTLFGPMDKLLEKAGWDDENQDRTKFAITLLAELGISSPLSVEDAATCKRDLVEICKRKLLNTPLVTEENPFYHRLRQAWLDDGLEDIDSLEDLLKLGARMMIAASAQGKVGEQVCTWLPISEQETAVSYDRSLSDINRMKEGYPAIINLMHLEPAIHSPLRKDGSIFCHRESFEVPLVKLIDKKSLLDVAARNAWASIEKHTPSTSLSRVFEATLMQKTPSQDIGFFAAPLRMNKISFKALADFFPWISLEKREDLCKMNSKEKVRILLRCKKEFFEPERFKTANEFNYQHLYPTGEDGECYHRLTAFYHRHHIVAMNFILNAKVARKSAITFKQAPLELPESLMMLAMIPEEYTCRNMFIDKILTSDKATVVQSLIQLIRDYYLTYEETNELIQELLQTKSQLAAFFKLFYAEQERLALPVFIQFLTLTLENNLSLAATALNKLYDDELISLSLLADVVKKLPQFTWQMVVLAMVSKHCGDRLKKYRLFILLDELDKDLLLNSSETLLKIFESAGEDRDYIIEYDISPLKDYIQTVRTLSTDELAVLNYFFLDRRDVSIAHLKKEDIYEHAESLGLKCIISLEEAGFSDKLPEPDHESETRILQKLQ